MSDSMAVISAAVVLALMPLTAWAMTRFLQWRDGLRTPRRFDAGPAAVVVEGGVRATGHGPLPGSRRDRCSSKPSE